MIKQIHYLAISLILISLSLIGCSPKNYSINIHTIGEGTTDPIVGNYTYKEGETVTVKAIPNDDWQFDNWSGDVTDSTSAVMTMNIDSDKDITAKFSKITYALTLKCVGSGTVNPKSGIYSYDPNTVISITAIPSAGWQFDSWSGDISGTQTSISVTLSSNQDITAKFSKITYPLTLTCIGNGTINPEAGVHSYDPGTVVNITATPTEGWKFDGWSGDASGTQTTIITTLSTSKTIIAIFSKITYNLTLTCIGNGTINPEAGVHSYDPGTVVNITATPSQGWIFEGWSGDASGTQTIISVILVSNQNVTANFINISPAAISGITATQIDDSTATISWNTDISSDSIVEYGLSSTHGSIGGNSDALSLSHTVILNGLEPNTTYHYSIRTKTNAGVTSNSDDLTFTTKSIAKMLSASSSTGLSFTTSGTYFTLSFKLQNQSKSTITITKIEFYDTSGRISRMINSDEIITTWKTGLIVSGGSFSGTLSSPINLFNGWTIKWYFTDAKGTQYFFPE